MQIFVTIVIQMVTGVVVGYSFSKTMTHPAGKLRKKLPCIRVKWIQLLPHLIFEVKGKKVHIHHWVTLPTIWLPLILSSDLLRAQLFLHGIILGSVIQGLRYKDRFVFFINEMPEQLLQPFDDSSSSNSSHS